MGRAHALTIKRRTDVIGIFPKEPETTDSYATSRGTIVLPAEKSRIDSAGLLPPAAPSPATTSFRNPFQLTLDGGGS